MGGDIAVAWTEIEEKRGRIRIALTKQDLDQIGSKDVHQSTVLEWIKKGKERSIFEEEIVFLKQELTQLREDISVLKNEQRSQVMLLAQLSHLMTLMTTEQHLRLKKLREKSKKGHLSDEERALNDLFEAKSLNFQSFIQELFSGLKTNYFLSPQGSKDEPNQD